MYDDKSEYYIPNWAGKMGPESGFINSLRSYKCYGRNDVTTIPRVAITVAFLAAIRADRRLSVECEGGLRDDDTLVPSRWPDGLSQSVVLCL